jgi:hypothetical protein
LTFALTSPQLAACFSGLIAGILGLTNFSGFLLYLLTSLLSALSIASLKCGFDVSKYVPQAHGAGAGGQGTTVSAAGEVRGWKGWVGLLGLGQENLLGFLLFWIGSYALIHGESSRVESSLGLGLRFTRTPTATATSEFYSYSFSDVKSVHVPCCTDPNFAGRTDGRTDGRIQSHWLPQQNQR